MNNTTDFTEGATLTLLDGSETVSATITQLSKRRLELTLVQPFPLLFHLSRPMYLSRFLLGDGFLGPEGEPFARDMLLKLHRAATYIEHELPRVAVAFPLEGGSGCRNFLEHLADLLGPDTLASNTTFRDAVLRVEQELTPVGASAWPMLRWQEPYITRLYAIQANVLLYHWLRYGPFELRADTNETYHTQN
jgi:hypothetical protein